MYGIANKIIDRVVMCLTNNENYIDFWNYTSKVYREKFNTIPTLMFSGTSDDLNYLKSSGRLSQTYGEIIHLPRVDGIFFDPNLDWTCTWGLFYGASLFPDDVCMLSGIDQIPLSSRFYDLINNVNVREKYIVGFSDGYAHEDADFPSSHHVSLGKNFKKMYSIDDAWEDELKKVYNHKEVRERVKTPSLWGMDEAYSSYFIKQYIKNNNSPVDIVLITGFFNYWRSRRIDRAVGAIPVNQQILEAIKGSEFTEYHSVRPFSANTGMNLVYDAIPKVVNISTF